MSVVGCLLSLARVHPVVVLVLLRSAMGVAISRTHPLTGFHALIDYVFTQSVSLLSVSLRLLLLLPTVTMTSEKWLLNVCRHGMLF